MVSRTCRHSCSSRHKFSLEDVVGPPPYRCKPIVEDQRRKRRPSRSLNGSKRALVAADSCQELLRSSFPCDLQLGRTLAPPPKEPKELREVIVHRLEEVDRSPRRNRRSYEHAQLREVGGGSCASSDPTSANSSSSEAEPANQNLLAIQATPAFTTV